MKTLVLTLKETPDRKIQFERNNSTFIADYEFFEGTNGKADANNLRKDSKFCLDCSDYTDGALGSAHSWYRILNYISINNENYIVLEDDIQVNQQFSKHVEQLVKDIDDTFDMLYLNYNTIKTTG